MRYRAVKNMIVDILHMCQAAHPRAGIGNPRWQAGASGLVKGEGDGDGYVTPRLNITGNARTRALPNHVLNHVHNNG